jgi:CheY-like chemotaxis protein
MSGPVLGSGQMHYLLVVNSDLNERFTLSMLLQRFGYSTVNATSAAEGVEFLCVSPAVAVFAEATEIGLELAALLNKDIRFRDVPIIMVAQHEDHDLEERIRQGDFAGLLRSPISPDAAYQVVQKIIEKGSRVNIRIPIALPSTVTDAERSTDGYATVLSQYGMFFRTLNPRPVNSFVDVNVYFSDRVINLKARVLYIISFDKGPFCESGMGLKFVDIASEDKALIRFIIYEQLGSAIVYPEPGSISGQA